MNVQYVGQQQRSGPIVLQQQPQTVMVQQRAQPMLMQEEGECGECMGCDCGMGCGDSMRFPVMGYYSISGLLIFFGLLHIGVGIAASVLITSCPVGTLGLCGIRYSMISVLIGTGVLYTITGCIGTCAAGCRTAHMRSGLKTGFLVLAILSALVVVGSIASMSTIVAAGTLAVSSEMLALSAIGLVGGIIVFLLTVTGSGIACCCSPVSESPKSMMY